MTIVPLGMLVMLIIWMAGGPRNGLAWMENFLRALMTWAGQWVR